ncbi:unnamed protein product [Ectocarpus sp. 12 AP-2014]
MLCRPSVDRRGGDAQRCIEICQHVLRGVVPVGVEVVRRCDDSSGEAVVLVPCSHTRLSLEVVP